MTIEEILEYNDEKEKYEKELNSKWYIKLEKFAGRILLFIGMLIVIIISLFNQLFQQ